MESITLPSGEKMPILGLGTWQAPGAEVKAAVITAIEAGYRHIDCALAYQNEAAVGDALKECFELGKIKREDVWITTKLWCTHMQGSDVRACCDESLRRLKLDYIDLYIVHHPIAMKNPNDNYQTMVPKDADDNVLYEDLDLIANWREMEKLQKAGLVKNIGVSNYSISQMKRIQAVAEVPIANHQLELNAYLAQEAQVKFCHENNISVVAFAPIGAPGRPPAMHNDPDKPDRVVLLQDPVVQRIAKKHSKTPAQVLIRNLIQRRIVPIPKSANPDRVKENFKVFDFELDETDMNDIKAINKDEMNFDYMFFPGAEKTNEFPLPLDG